MFNNKTSLMRPVYKSYTVKHIRIVNNGSSFTKELVNPISFRMKEHATTFKTMLKIVHPHQFFIIDTVIDDDSTIDIYDFELKKK